MTPVLPLLLLWAFSRRNDAPSAPSLPNWPTPRSPPPPVPAFVPSVPEPSPHGTPLPALHNAKPATPKPKGKPSIPTSPSALKAAAMKEAQKRLHVSLPGGLSIPGFGGSSTPTKVATVYDVQQIVNTHGGSLTPDGLYGPNTARAWASLAQSKGLPTLIKRNGPKTAKVAVQTFDALSVPPIP